MVLNTPVILAAARAIALLTHIRLPGGVSVIWGFQTLLLHHNTLNPEFWCHGKSPVPANQVPRTYGSAEEIPEELSK